MKCEIEMRGFWRWRFDAEERERLRDPICWIIVGLKDDKFEND